MSLQSPKVAFITGSGKKRVGNVIALEAARRGFDVAIHYRTSQSEAETTAQQIRALGVRAECFAADLGSVAETESLCARVIKTFGRIDLFVPAAGIWEKTPLESLTAEKLSENFNVNTLSTFLCCQHIGLQMCKQTEGGAIVLIGDAALERPYDHFSAYFLSKGAIPTLTLTLANELAHRNPKVRVNCVHPGAVLLPENLGDIEKRGVVEKSLVKSLGSPESVAQAVFSFYENPYLTGSFLRVDGGEAISN